jgi:hypothetical protein
MPACAQPVQDRTSLWNPQEKREETPQKSRRRALSRKKMKIFYRPTFTEAGERFAISIMPQQNG